MKLQSVQFPPITCCLISLRPTCLRQHPIPEHPQPTFLTRSRDHWMRVLCPLQKGARCAGPQNVFFQTLIRVWDVRLKEHTRTARLTSRDYVNFLGCYCFYRSVLNAPKSMYCRSYCTCSIQFVSECCVSLKFLYEKLHYKNHVSVSVTKLAFRFTACLNKTLHILMHRNIFCLTFASFSTGFLFHSNVLLSLMFQHILSEDNQGIFQLI